MSGINLTNFIRSISVPWRILLYKPTNSHR